MSNLEEHVDFIIVGQGLCGTLLSYFLWKEGKKFIVIDDENEQAATRVASGIINPVTGRRIVRSWRIEEFLPFAIATYSALSNLLNSNFIEAKPILEFHTTPQMELAFVERMKVETDYLHSYTAPAEQQQWFNFPFGITAIQSTYLIHLTELINSWKTKLKAEKKYLKAVFEESYLKFFANGKVTYKSITANKIIYCHGILAAKSTYFKQLPFSANKGEVLIVDIPNLPRKHIYKHGFTLVPWQQNSLFWLGSTYEWQFNTEEPTEAFKTKATNWLNQFVKLPFSLVAHKAAVRPATLERRPFVGVHPSINQLALFTGMGTKGCSLAPFFAKELVNHLLFGDTIAAEVSLLRFQRILSVK